MIKKKDSKEFTVHIISFALVVAAAIFGWLRLQYGFNFIDEGWEMTEAWRITVGDNFFKDKFTGFFRNSTLINALIFKLYPGISLLEFRQLYFILTVFSLLFFSFSLHKATNDRIYFYLIIFSIFSFTGLDVTGMIPNLNYYTYRHLFLTVHLSFLIMGIVQESILLRKTLLFMSGIFLWLISFSLLHLSLSVASVIFIYVIMKFIHADDIHFNFYDAFFVLMPFVLLWSAIIIIYGREFITIVFSTLHLAFSVPTYNFGLLFSINWEYSKLMMVTTIFTIAFLLSIRIVKICYSLCAQLAVSTLMLLVLKTNIFGFYTRATTGALWFSCFLLSSSFLFLLYFTVKAFKKESFEKNDVIRLILFISGITLAMIGIFFSSYGMLIAVYSSIPLTAAISFSILSLNTLQKRAPMIRWLMIIIFLAPFYFVMAYERWQFNLYDVSPQQATATIDEGFCKNIKTNHIYKNLHDWIRKTSETYSTKDDFVISYVSSPMVHMIARRRPATDDSYIAFDVMPQSYYEKSLTFMKMRHRRPRLVYVFEAMPALTSLNSDGHYLVLWMDKQIVFPSDDPFSDYVVKNTTLIERFTISEELSIYARCFIDNAARLNMPPTP